MARTTINSLGVPAGTITAADLSYPLTDFSSTGIDDNATSTAITISSSEYLGIGTTIPEVLTHLKSADNTIFQLESTDANVYMKMVDSNTTGAGYIGYETNDMTFWANNTERMRIDSSGRLLLGNSSSVSVTNGQRQFQIQGTNGVTSSITVRRSQNSSGAPSLSFAKDRGSVSTAVVSGDALGAIYFAGSDGTDLNNDAASIIGWADGTPSSNSTPGRLAFYTNGGSTTSTERMRIASDGKVTVYGISRFENYIEFAGSISTPATAAAIYRPADNNLAFSTANTEAMRIDSSGNLLVGKTSASTSTVGAEMNSDGTLVAVRASGNPLLLNRTTTDGAIATFRKNNTTIANIGVNGGDEPYFARNVGTTSGIKIANGALYPCQSDGTNHDNAQNLGISTARWANLYLSNGVYLGGTGVANHLDDYEEGTYTVYLYDASSGGNSSAGGVTGYYTKVGRLVHLNFYAFNNIDTTGMTSTNPVYYNLPFTSGANGRCVGAVNTHGWTFAGSSSGRTMIMPQITQNSSRGYFAGTGNGYSDVNIVVSDISSGADDIVTFTITYWTDD